MASVIFLRGVNVGGRKAFRPAAVARELAEFDVVNVGAAGTFVVRKPVGEAALRTAVLGKLPFVPEVLICPGREVTKLEFPAASPEGVTRYVTVLAKKPRTMPRLPVERPEGADWQVRLLAITGRFVLSLHRRQPGRALVYPNEVVEKLFALSATTRNWNTIVSVRDILNGS